jgi:AGCS family alanine or glycine:cation symporter
VAATAYARHPVGQGVVQALSVFIDTMILCTCTAFMILLSDVYQPGAPIDGIVLVQDSLTDHFGIYSQYFLTVAILLFAFSSIIYNYYLGENALTILTGSDAAVHVLRLAIVGVVFLGCTAPQATAVFFFSDPLMGVLALVNLLALAMLFPVGLRILDDFRAKLRAGEDHPLFHPEEFPDLDLDRSAWPGARAAA